MKFVKGTHGADLFEQMMGKGGSKNGLGANLLQKSKTKEKWDLC